MFRTQRPRPFAIILCVPDVADKAYVRNPSAILALVVLCPLCLDAGVEHRLAKNGRYRRWIPVGRCLVWSWIYRRYCRRCDTAFSLIPEFVAVGMTYGRRLLHRWLWSSLWCVPSRSRGFLQKHAVCCPVAEPRTSWSDLLACVPSRPGYALLCRWTREFSARAGEAIPWLLATFMAQGNHWRLDLAEPLSVLRRVPERAYALALALGLWRAILEGARADGDPVRLVRALPSLIDYLLVFPSRASHNLIRVPGAALGYSRESTAGRAPPASATGRSRVNGTPDV